MRLRSGAGSFPFVFGDAAPHLAEVAQIAGKSEAAIIDDLENANVRVLALGFAPGNPISDYCRRNGICRAHRP